MILGSILGLGIELVDVARFAAADARFGRRFRERLFTEGERAYAARKRRADHSLAVRFAAKVAGHRALGLVGFRWQEVEVVRERGSAPTLRFHDRARERAAALGVERVSLTLTHDPSFCVGQVLLEKER